MHVERHNGLRFPGKANSHSAVLHILCVFMCAVFSCFRNPPNYDKDYRIVNVRTFLCVRIHTGVGHTDNESAQHFDSEKLSQFMFVLRTEFEPLFVESIWISRPTLN